MATEDDKQEILVESLVDLRRVYDCISSAYDHLRAKALAMIVAETAIISFIFANGNRDSFILPAATDRRIFFFTAVTFLSLAFGILLWIVSTVGWKLPHDVCSVDQLARNYKDRQGYLEHVHEDYVKDINHNTQVTSPRFKRFNWAIYLLSAGVIMIIVLKYGG